MKIPVYPLIQVLQVKIKRVEQQEKVVQQKKEALDEEERKLAEREAARDKVLNHHNDKLQQLRDELDHETNSETIKQMKLYLKEVKIKLEVEEKKVKEQKERVEVAKKELAEAQAELNKRRIDVDKIKMHEKDWIIEMRKELQVLEDREEDDLGQIIFAKHQRERIKK